MATSLARSQAFNATNAIVRRDTTLNWLFVILLSLLISVLTVGVVCFLEPLGKQFLDFPFGLNRVKPETVPALSTSFFNIALSSLVERGVKFQAFSCRWEASKYVTSAASTDFHA
jgi:hypothetical protein